MWLHSGGTVPGGHGHADESRKGIPGRRPALWLAQNGLHAPLSCPTLTPSPGLSPHPPHPPSPHPRAGFAVGLIQDDEQPGLCPDAICAPGPASTARARVESVACPPQALGPGLVTCLSVQSRAHPPSSDCGAAWPGPGLSPSLPPLEDPGLPQPVLRPPPSRPGRHPGKRPGTFFQLSVLEAAPDWESRDGVWVPVCPR